MSADKLIKTQNHSGAIVKSMGKYEDVFKQHPSQRVGLIRNAAVRRRSINFPQPFAFGATLSARIPQVDYLGDMYIKITTNALQGAIAAFNLSISSANLPSPALQRLHRNPLKFPLS